MSLRKALFLTAIALTPGLAPAAPPALCPPGAAALWSGTARARTYAVCGLKSHGVAFMQYRARHAGRTDLAYPSTPLPARGHFTFSESAHAASLAFSHAGYTYTIREPMAGPTVIRIERASESVAEIPMDSASNTLTDNADIAFFRAAGIAD